MNKKTVILGNGYIGQRLQEELNCVISDKKILSFKDAEALIKKLKPKVLINCIGYIGRSVDDCELDKDKTLLANVFVPVMLAEAALRNNIRLIHISSGCIYHYDYSEDKPIPETKEPDFFELFYSRSKIYCEDILRILSKKYPILIARIRVPLDDRPHSRNLLDKLINYKKVIDLPNSITYIPDFVRALKHLINIKAAGIYNIALRGPLIYSKLMRIYQKHVAGFKYEIINFKKLKMVRTNLILSTKKLEKSGFKVRKIDEVLEECVIEYLKH